MACAFGRNARSARTRRSDGFKAGGGQHGGTPRALVRLRGTMRGRLTGQGAQVRHERLALDQTQLAELRDRQGKARRADRVEEDARRDAGDCLDVLLREHLRLRRRDRQPIQRDRERCGCRRHR